ncbi:MAG: hypothetical protein HKN78_10955 [Sphingomonadaceae bacterium]|nr:hypothetical protein [Sphingomonadaceae bacterium]
MNHKIANLIREHRSIDKQVSGAAYASPHIHRLKRLRLRLKDRIVRSRRREALKIA